VLSCLICTHRGASFINTLLNHLGHQSLDKRSFEILILDNTPQGLEGKIEGRGSLPIQISRNASTHGFIGALRNEIFRKAKGEYILFLDDDTQILQKDFLHKALELFKHTDADIIMPCAYGIASDKMPHYHYLDNYSFAARCCLYKKSILDEVGVFRENITAYEDIDLGIRMRLRKAKILKTPLLEYHHPVLFFDSLQKPLAIGQSILKLRAYYPWYLWILIYLNALRFLPLILVPTMQNRQWFKISWGVFLAPFMKERKAY